MSLAAISIDDTTDALKMSNLVHANFPLLSDPDARVCGDYGVYNLLGDDVATPATFIIDSGGAIRWRYVGKNAGDRPSAGQTIARLDNLLALDRS